MPGRSEISSRGKVQTGQSKVPRVLGRPGTVCAPSYKRNGGPPSVSTFSPFGPRATLYKACPGGQKSQVAERSKRANQRCLGCLGDPGQCVLQATSEMEDPPLSRLFHLLAHRPPSIRHARGGQKSHVAERSKRANQRCLGCSGDPGQCVLQATSEMEDPPLSRLFHLLAHRPPSCTRHAGAARNLMSQKGRNGPTEGA